MATKKTKKTNKPKHDPGESYSVTDTLVEIDVVVETIEKMQDNMDILNKNTQHAIDKIEEMENKLKQISTRMGL